MYLDKKEGYMGYLCECAIACGCVFLVIYAWIRFKIAMGWDI